MKSTNYSKRLFFYAFFWLALSALYSTAYAKIIVHYQFTGLSGSPLRNVQDRLKLVEEELPTPLTQANILTLYQEAPENIVRALQPYGYFKPQIKSRKIQRQNEFWLIFNIDPGPPLLIHQVNIRITGKGAHDPEIQSLAHDFPLKSGQILKTKKYNLAKQALYNVAQKQGYLKAQLTHHVIHVNLARYIADIDLSFDTGERFYFGNTEFTPTPFAEAFLQRYVPFEYGQPYSRDALLKLQNDLGHTIYFESVNVQPQYESQDEQHIPVIVELKPRKTQLYTIGAGFGTDTGPRASLGYEWRRVTSNGDYFQSVIQASAIQKSFQSRYVIPGKNPTTDHYTIIGGLATNLPGEGEYRTLTTGFNYVNQVKGFVQTLGLTYQNERFRIYPNDPFTTTNYIVPSISWEKVQADDRVNTTNGYRTLFNIQAGESTDFNNYFLQGEFQGKFIKSLGKRQRIILRTDIGGTAVKNIATFPLSLRYFAGGATSIRGFSFQSIGPGRYLMVGSAEYQFRVYKKWYAAAFYDAGDAFNHTLKGINQSSGLGILYRSPLGPLEFTISRPLNYSNPNFFKGLRFQFVMGPDL